MNILPPTPVNPIVTQDGRMNQEFLLWTQNVSQGLIIGTGSPEGVVQSGQGALYMDSSGTSGSILYVKRDSDVGGNSAKGWVLV